MTSFKNMLASGLMLATSFGVSAQGLQLSENEKAMVAWVDAHQDEAIALLEKTVNIGSGTMNHAGVRAVGDVMAGELDALGLETRWIDMPEEMNRAGHLFATKKGQGKRFLLIGHLDTVFEADDDFQAFTRDGNIATGPGIADMKDGNAVIVYALKALQHIGALDGIPITVAYTGDEEKSGRPLSISRRDLIEAGKWADIALGFEGAITSEGSDWATIARRSSSSWMLEVKGKQAHSSSIFSESTGAGAINEASRILSEFYTNVQGDYGLTFNAGTIKVVQPSTTTRAKTAAPPSVRPMLCPTQQWYTAAFARCRLNNWREQKPKCRPLLPITYRKRRRRSVSLIATHPWLPQRVIVLSQTNCRR